MKKFWLLVYYEHKVPIVPENIKYQGIFGGKFVL